MYVLSFIQCDVCVCDVYESVTDIKPFWSLQEALLESERGNMEGRNSDALAVCIKIKTTPEVFLGFFFPKLFFRSDDPLALTSA